MLVEGVTSLTLSQLLAQDIIDHALDEKPNECCGILLGLNGLVHEVSRAINVDMSPVKYTIDPADMQRIFTMAEKKGLQILAFYHSHTFTEAYPSVTDIKLMPPVDLFDYLYLIVSLADKEKPVMRLFRNLGEGEVAELDVRIIA